MSITAREARRRLFSLSEEVNDNAESVEIVSGSGRAYLVPAAEYESWNETEYLLANPANAHHLLASIREAEAGHVHERELIAVNEARSPLDECERPSAARARQRQGKAALRPSAAREQSGGGGRASFSA